MKTLHQIAVLVLGVSTMGRSNARPDQNAPHWEKPGYVWSIEIGDSSAPYQQLPTGGGPVSLKGTDWRCKTSPVTASTFQEPQATSFQSVTLECSYRGGTVLSFVSCLKKAEWGIERVAVVLEDAEKRRVMVAVMCTYRESAGSAK